MALEFDPFTSQPPDKNIPQGCRWCEDTGPIRKLTRIQNNTKG